MREIPTTPIIISGDTEFPFNEILVRDTITNKLFKFKILSFSAN